MARRFPVKESVLKYYTKFTGKYLHQGLFFYKISPVLESLFKACNFIKKRRDLNTGELYLKNIFWHRCFSENFTILLRTTFFIKHLQWLLL